MTLLGEIHIDKNPIYDINYIFLVSIHLHLLRGKLRYLFL